MNFISICLLLTLIMHLIYSTFFSSARVLRRRAEVKVPFLNPSNLANGFRVQDG